MPLPESKVGLVKKEEVRIDPRGIELLRLMNKFLNIENKKRIVQLIEEIGEEIVNSVLSQNELDVLAVYPKNEKGNFRGQKIAAFKLYGTPSKFPYVAGTFRMAVRKIGWRLVNGENAIEILKPPDFLYNSAVRLGIRRIDQIHSLSEEELRKLCGSPFGLKVLKEAMEARGINWEPPEVRFSSLSSGPGYSRTPEGRIYRTEANR